MLTYRLVKNLIATQDSEWKQLVKNSLGTNAHPRRIHSYCLSREALRLCFEARGIRVAIGDLILEGFGAVKNHDLLTISLSHTPEFGAAVIAEIKDVVSVGIDIEPMERSVKATILERISHPEDIKLNALSIWSLKEAIFKAVMNSGKLKQTVEFSELKIDHETWVHEPSQVRGQWKLEEQQGLVVALAWIKI